MAALGGYKMAAMFVNTVVYELGKNITAVFFPAYVRIRDDRAKLRKFFLQLYAALVAILAPICLWMFLTSSDLVRVILGNRWAGSSPLLSMLALAGLVQVFIVAGSGLFYALRKPQYKTLCEAVSLVTLLAFLFYLPSRFGIVGVSAALLLSSVLACCLYVGLWMSLLGISLSEFMGMHTATFCSLGLMWVGISLCGEMVESIHLRFLLTSAVGVAVYLCAQMVAARVFHAGPAVKMGVLFSRNTK